MANVTKDPLEVKVENAFTIKSVHCFTRNVKIVTCGLALLGEELTFLNCCNQVSNVG